MANPVPIEINYHQKSKLLKIVFNNQTECMLSAEFLRVYSPSAEVQGHHPSEAVLQIGKENVAIAKIEPVGNYAIKLVFDDHHDTVLFTWDYLYELAKNYDILWQDYQLKLKQHFEKQ